LLEVVATAHSSRGLTCGLNSRQQEPNEYSDDRDNDQEFDKGETLSGLIAFHKSRILEKKENTAGVPKRKLLSASKTRKKGDRASPSQKKERPSG
jgi:hypothetical protein